MLAEVSAHDGHSIPNRRSNSNGRVADGAALACGLCLNASELKFLHSPDHRFLSAYEHRFDPGTRKFSVTPQC